MKKTVCIFLALVCVFASAFALASCNDAVEPEDVIDSASDTEDTTDPADTSADTFVPEGYQLYDNGAISFAYPAGWLEGNFENDLLSAAYKSDDLADIINPLLEDEAALDAVEAYFFGNGNAIIVCCVESDPQVAEFLASAPIEEAPASMAAMVESMGLPVSDVSAEWFTNEHGTSVLKFSMKPSMEGVSLTQTMFICASDEHIYVVTVTARSERTEIADTVFATLSAVVPEEE